jgi:hypothetical protein
MEQFVSSAVHVRAGTTFLGKAIDALTTDVVRLTFAVNDGIQENGLRVYRMLFQFRGE